MLLRSAASCVRTLSGHSLLTADSAITIANKLEAEITEGRRHTNVVVRVGGTYIGRFGIRRGSSAGHDYIPRQIYVTMKEALGLARCTLYMADYEKILKERHNLP